MEIAINLVAFIPGTMGGCETYLRNLLRELQRVDAVNRYRLLCDRHYRQELELNNPRFTVVPCNYTRPSPKWFVRGVLRNAVKIDILKPVFQRMQVDLIHHPFSFMNPLHAKVPSVLTFNDMQHEYFPELFSAYELKARAQFYRPSAELATRIIAISRHAKSCLVEKYQTDPEKIDVIYNGYSQAYRILDEPGGLEKIRSKHELHRPFMYYPAATWPHKNHKTLLTAFRLLKDRHRFDGQLVLTGIAMKAHGDILKEIARLGLEDSVKVLGYLPYEELPCLYNLARIMVFPSLFEGFGMPLVEAMACGCPVACSDVTSIPEVVGDAGILFDPRSPEDMAAKIWSLWNDDAMRRVLAGRGLERVKLFSWESTARETVKIYEKVASR